MEFTLIKEMMKSHRRFLELIVKVKCNASRAEAVSTVIPRFNDNFAALFNSASGFLFFFFSFLFLVVVAVVAVGAINRPLLYKAASHSAASNTFWYILVFATNASYIYTYIYILMPVGQCHRQLKQR